ncbi:NAD(P)/FAD-dependent oxidoreductase [Thalassobacillus devorans]|uniref:NAD(P)/FAD-dependent oxidoreductase n=1 Tax=Thalassobacillus devorans TaxID=279813 RepID=UPI0004913393|nr:FAD-dependent oxidoreductase [Thalassobacillus devorans]
MTTKVILVGGGHAHLHVIRTMIEERADQVELLLISRSSFQVYSPMLAGYAEGNYTKDQVQIDLRKLCSKAKVPFIQREAAYIDTGKRKLVCKDGAVYPFDILSLDIGAKNPQKLLGENDSKDRDIFKQIDTLRESHSPLIVSEDALGVELALAIQAYKRRLSKKGHVRLLGENRLCQSEAQWTHQKILRILKKHNVQVWEGESIQATHDDHLLTEKNNKIRFTEVFWHGRPAPGPIYERSSLPTNENGFVENLSTLQVKDHPYIFAVGDGTALGSKSKHADSEGHAVKQGELLWKNICSSLEDTSLDEFHPQKRSYSIISTGDQEGLLIYGAVSVHNKQAWKVRSKLDQNYMNYFLND